MCQQRTYMTSCRRWDKANWCSWFSTPTLRVSAAANRRAYAHNPAAAAATNALRLKSLYSSRTQLYYTTSRWQTTTTDNKVARSSSSSRVRCEAEMTIQLPARFIVQRFARLSLVFRDKVKVKSSTYQATIISNKLQRLPALIEGNLEHMHGSDVHHPTV